jgi:hypothetical protein
MCLHVGILVLSGMQVCSLGFHVSAWEGLHCGCRAGVPVDRQKLMAKGAWKGVLKDDEDLSVVPEGQQVTCLTLIRSRSLRNISDYSYSVGDANGYGRCCEGP